MDKGMLFRSLLLVLTAIFCNASGSTDLREAVAVGIDLGTTYSCISVYSPSLKDTKFVLSPSGEETYPSVVYFKKLPEGDGNKSKYEAIAGWPGLQMYNAEGNANTYFYAFKRGMGIEDLANIDKKVEDIKRNASVPIFVESVGGKKRVAYKIQENDLGSYESVTPEELSSHVLRMLKDQILREYRIQGITITVPAYFDLNQVAATVKAAEMAGLPTPMIWKEPSAAAFAHTYDLIRKGITTKEEVDDMNICVFDLGGGTFDVSIVESSGGFMMVPNYGGNNFLGGENVNDNLTQYFASHIKSSTGFDVMENQNVKLRLRNLVEEMKRDICDEVRKSPGRKANSSISKSFIYDGEKSITLELTNEKFNKLNEDFYSKIRKTMDLLLSGDGKENKGYDKNLINRVLLVGGSTRIPKVIDIVEEIFGADKIYYEGVNADTIVARGAALYTANELSMLSESEQIVTADSVPLSLGICTEEDHFEAIISKGALLPATGTKEFTTAQDNQVKVRIRVAQGGLESFKDNIYIGDIELDLPGNQPRGVPRIGVTLEIDTHGKIYVKAVDLQNDKTADAYFSSVVANMTSEEIERFEERVHSEENQELVKKREVVKKLEYALSQAENPKFAEIIPENIKKDALEYVQKTRLWLEKHKEIAPRIHIEEKLQEFDNGIKEFLSSAKSGEEKEVGREEL
ncbi:DnaK-like protein [Encephalitozoon romaleae SJ-2008]|uniref:DnaK-like protein n=1 Tax=Encephalitozoon romaleae (strain SJ-2008) TaxID=1178016 RepID=I6ZS95_ENCRO|nr:DnaK-like protein [Encephalitozoon romaleae SJ-2008]AFN82476.1 DnaK-like protein [Encephalitozoon romaleae SJ-2008]